MKDNLSFRNAERKDVALILEFVRELAEYEKMSGVRRSDRWDWNRKSGRTFRRDDGMRMCNLRNRKIWNSVSKIFW